MPGRRERPYRDRRNRRCDPPAFRDAPWTSPISIDLATPHALFGATSDPADTAEMSRDSLRQTAPLISTPFGPRQPVVVAVAVIAVAFFATATILASWTLPGEGSRLPVLLSTLLRDGGVALLWWLGASGFGVPLARLVIYEAPCIPGDRASVGEADSTPRTSLDLLALATALGAAVLLTLASALGTIGIATHTASWLPWSITAVGLFLLIRALRTRPLQISELHVVPDDRPNDRAARTRIEQWMPWIVPTAVGALLALFATAAASAPGWLWSSEFGGFDALSYHLELPKAWLLTAQPVGPVEGNVYSALPSFVEAAFVQVLQMRGSIVEGSVACQYWAACAAIATAFVVARLAHRMVGEGSGTIAFLLLLSLPWMIVTGTLAYNDVLPCLMFAAAWFVIEQQSDSDRTLRARDAITLALLAAVAVGAKPTAFLFVALPLLALVVMRCGVRTLRYAPLVLAIALLALSPWLIRNQLAYGNPLFPFAHTMLGSGPWTDEQFVIFARGHGSEEPLLSRASIVWSQWLAHGTGVAPAANEPWFPQWGILPIAGLVGLGYSARTSRAARAALVAIAIALLGWLLATHLKSRFLLPTAVPLALGVAMLVARIPRTAQPLLALSLVAPMIALAFFAYWREPARTVRASPDVEAESLRAPAQFVGQTAFMTGELFAREVERVSPEQREQLAAAAPLAFIVNRALPASARILSVGLATPFYLARPIEWNTVWDRGVLDRIADEQPDTPERWGARLRELGYTHVVVQPTMLLVWERSGWLNPRLKPDRWLRAFLDSAPRRVRASDGAIVVEL